MSTTKKGMEELSFIVLIIILIILLLAAGMLYFSLSKEGGSLLDKLLNLF